MALSLKDLSKKNHPSLIPITTDSKENPQAIKEKTLRPWQSGRFPTVSGVTLKAHQATIYAKLKERSSKILNSSQLGNLSDGNNQAVSPSWQEEELKKEQLKVKYHYKPKGVLRLLMRLLFT